MLKNFFMYPVTIILTMVCSNSSKRRVNPKVTKIISFIKSQRKLY